MAAGAALSIAVSASYALLSQIVLPAELRRLDAIREGQEFEVQRLEEGVYKLERRSARANQGVVDWLLACPEKGYFVPVESESTDTL